MISKIEIKSKWKWMSIGMSDRGFWGVIRFRSIKIDSSTKDKEVADFSQKKKNLEENFSNELTWKLDVINDFREDSSV